MESQTYLLMSSLLSIVLLVTFYLSSDYRIITKPTHVHPPIVPPVQPLEKGLEEGDALGPATDEHQAPLGELPAEVTNSDSPAYDRSTWVRRINGHVFEQRHKGRHNVLTINTELEYYLSMRECIEEFNVPYWDSDGRKIVYRIVVFDKGELVNLGDGGFINWMFEGSYVRTGVSTLSFRPISKR
jgi:hypothetical protein